MNSENIENTSDYNPDSERAKIGDAFSKETLEDIQRYIPEAKHSEGLNAGYDIIIPLEEYGYPKIECKVCGSLTNGDFKKYVKIPASLFDVTESKFIRLKYKNNFDEYSTYYFRTSSLKKYYDKMANKVKILQEDDRSVILWPAHLLEGMFTKINTTEDLVEMLEKDKKFRTQNTVEKDNG